MRRVTAVSIPATLLLVILQSMAIADTSLEELLSGRLAPLTIKLGDLDSGWRRFNVAESGSVFADYLTIMAAREMTPTPLTIYYTRGTTYQVGGETYLLAYQQKPRISDIARTMQYSDDSDPPVLTTETELAPSLLNLRAVVAMRDIRAFSLDEEIAESKALFGADEYDENAPSEGVDQSLQNLHVMGQALSMYIQAWGEKLPPMKNPEQVRGLLHPYASQIRPGAPSMDIFTDPRTGDLYPVNTILSLHKVAHIQFPQDMAVFHEGTEREDGSRAVLFLDGHVARVSREEWPIIKRKSKIP